MKKPLWFHNVRIVNRMQAPRVHRTAIILAVFLAGITGCAERTGQATGPAPAPPELVVGAGVVASDVERAALGRVARSLAMALSDEKLRHQLKNHLRASPFAEHKIELAAFLRAGNANELLRRMAGYRRQSESEILGGLSGIRSVELYIPYVEHRETWIGDEEVVVAAQLLEHDPVMAFDARGDAVPMDENTVPVKPTIVIVGTETRFDRPLSPLNSRNINDRNGEAIGTLVPISETPVRKSGIMEMPAECDSQTALQECGGYVSGGSAPPLQSGLYLEFSRILDAKEPRIRGNPEVEVHVHGPTDAHQPNHMYDVSCSGEWAPDPRKRFDQNDGFWSGRVLLLTNAELLPVPDLEYHIIYWEDDNEACTLKLDSNTVREYLWATLKAAGSAAVKLFQGYHWSVAATQFIGSFFASAGSWLLTNDDYIGDAIIPDPWALQPIYPDNTHIIMDGGRLNGRATINWR